MGVFLGTFTSWFAVHVGIIQLLDSRPGLSCGGGRVASEAGGRSSGREGAEGVGTEEIEVEETETVSHGDTLPAVPSGANVEREDGEIRDSSLEPNRAPLDMGAIHSVLVRMVACTEEDMSVQVQGAAQESESTCVSPPLHPAMEEGSGQSAIENYLNIAGRERMRLKVSCEYTVTPI